MHQTPECCVYSADAIHSFLPKSHIIILISSKRQRMTFITGMSEESHLNPSKSSTERKTKML